MSANSPYAATPAIRVGIMMASHAIRSIEPIETNSAPMPIRDSITASIMAAPSLVYIIRMGRAALKPPDTHCRACARHYPAGTVSLTGRFILPSAYARGLLGRTLIATLIARMYRARRYGGSR
jgi:hypothetical protein